MKKRRLRPEDIYWEWIKTGWRKDFSCSSETKWFWEVPTDLAKTRLKDITLGKKESVEKMKTNLEENILHWRKEERSQWTNAGTASENIDDKQ